MAMANQRSLRHDILWGGLALLILVPTWTWFVTRVIQPDSLIHSELSVSKIVLWLVATPIALVGAVIAWRQLSAGGGSTVTQAHASEAAVVATVDKRDYTLEVIGLGVTLDEFRQGALWEALSKKGNAWATIRSQDPSKVDWAENDKAGTSGGRTGHTNENALWRFQSYWGTPLMNAEPPAYNERAMHTPDDPDVGIAGTLDSDGLDYVMPISAEREFGERPDRLLDKVFAFFDANPDVPYVIVTADDDPAARDMRRAPGAPKLQHDGSYISAMPDASVAFVLAKRERVERLRPFAYHDIVDGGSEKVSFEELNHKGLGRRLYGMWEQLQGAVPYPQRREPSPYTPDQVPLLNYSTAQPAGQQRTVLADEWKRATAIFASRPDLRGSTVSALNPLSGPQVPHDWKPTPWFPIPWSKQQIATFDSAPTLGFLHRPVWVKLSDEQGKPLARADARQAALAKGWHDAVATLPEAQRATGPARVIVATGDNGERQIDLHRVLDTFHAEHEKAPAYDANKQAEFVNTDKRLGNTGAATFFMQMAIGTLASYADGNASAAINYRDPTEASIVMISPPSDEVRKKQGMTPLQDRATPAIDPANYAGTN